YRGCAIALHLTCVLIISVYIALHVAAIVSYVDGPWADLYLYFVLVENFVYVTSFVYGNGLIALLTFGLAEGVFGECTKCFEEAVRELSCETLDVSDCG